MPYFSDRELGERPRTVDQVGEEGWNGLRALIDSKIAGGWFGLDYPLQCPEGEVVCGTNRANFFPALRAEVPGIDLARPAGALPRTPPIFDAIEFCYRTIARPIQIGWHDYYRHPHLRFDREAGQATWHGRPGPHHLYCDTPLSSNTIITTERRGPAL